MLNENPLVSVIIPLWEGEPYIQQCLISLSQQQYSNFEVIVVDNASTDNGIDVVATHFPFAKTLKNQENLGYAGGCNVGLRYAQGEILVLLNQDTEVQPDWLANIVRAFHERDIGVVGCKILYADKVTLQHAGAYIEWPLGLAFHYGYGEQDEGQWDTARSVEFVSGAAMAFRRDVFEAVGMLDEGFWPGYFEDADYCFRIRQAGYEIWYAPEAKLTHLETTSIKDENLVSEAYQRGRLRFLLKHMSPDKFLTEFVPAEYDYQLPAILGRESRPLRMAYFEAIITAGEILQTQWNAEQSTIKAMVSALRELQRQAWNADWVKAEKTVPTFEADEQHRLKEIEFQSQFPMVGQLVAYIRERWYSVAARWAIRNLMLQQDRINRTHRHFILTLRRELNELAEENSRLSQEISVLRTKLKK